MFPFYTTEKKHNTKDLMVFPGGTRRVNEMGLICQTNTAQKMKKPLMKSNFSSQILHVFEMEKKWGTNDNTSCFFR